MQKPHFAYPSCHDALCFNWKVVLPGLHGCFSASLQAPAVGAPVKEEEGWKALGGDDGLLHLFHNIRRWQLPCCMQQVNNPGRGSRQGFVGFSGSSRVSGHPATPGFIPCFIPCRSGPTRPPPGSPPSLFSTHTQGSHPTWDLKDSGLQGLQREVLGRCWPPVCPGGQQVQ